MEILLVIKEKEASFASVHSNQSFPQHGPGDLVDCLIVFVFQLSYPSEGQHCKILMS